VFVSSASVANQQKPFHTLLKLTTNHEELSDCLKRLLAPLKARGAGFVFDNA
jgi:hypothetical protein